MARFSRDSGIAIGPILFVIAMLGILAAVMSASSGSYSIAGVSDRVQADIVTQANLIRSKIQECNTLYGTNSNGDGWPPSDPSNGTLVSALTCEGDPVGQQNIWSGIRNAIYPPATKGFNEWYYMNAGAAGGRCIWTSPVTGTANSGNVDGLTKASSKFTSQELSYLPASATQKFVIFLTIPTGTVDSHCAVP